jgi:transposase
LSFVAEPADVDGLKGRRQHAKTDQADAKHLRELVQAGTLPESWIPPVLVREMRAKVRLYKDLLDERGGWRQRIAAVLYHHGAPARPGVRHGERRWLDAEPALSPSGRQAGPLLSVVVWSEVGDTRRFHASHNAVRHTGLDISVYSSDGRRSRGHLTRQGPALLRRSGRITSLTTGSDGNPSDQNPPRALPRSHPAALRAVPP